MKYYDYAPQTRSITAIFWLGFFMAISFMEAPLKFTAPHLSMAEGLQIGRIIFGALNICEWIFFAVILVTLFINRAGARLYVIFAVTVILTLETFWLLPALDGDALRIINNQPPNHDNIHWVYVVLEGVKVPLLLMIGIENCKYHPTPPSAFNNDSDDLNEEKNG